MTTRSEKTNAIYVPTQAAGTAPAMRWLIRTLVADEGAWLGEESATAAVPRVLAPVQRFTGLKNDTRDQNPPHWRVLST